MLWNRFTIAVCLLWVGHALAAKPLTGYRTSVNVTEETRLDWIFPLANQSPASPPNGWLDDYDSSEQSYELFVPKNYDSKRSWPVVIFVSPGDKGNGYRFWRGLCQQEGIIFAGPHGAGNNCPTRKRVRIVLDVLDEVRRTYNTDVDRTYISGFSGGGRIACSIGFSLTEHFGGVLPICAAGDLRQESWLRHRAIDRLSVALVTGESDFNRGEVERFRGPLLANVGVRTRVWVVPKMGHSIPNSKQLATVVRWLDEDADRRRDLAKQHAAYRIAGDETPTRQQRARQLFAEATARIGDPKTLYSGLMLAKGVLVRWPDLPEAAKARELLQKHDANPDAGWQQEDIAEQRRFLVARARGLDAYASGPLPKAYAAQQANMTRAAINLWKQVIADGQDKAAVEEAQKRLPALEKALDSIDN